MLSNFCQAFIKLTYTYEQQRTELVYLLTI